MKNRIGTIILCFCMLLSLISCNGTGTQMPNLEISESGNETALSVSSSVSSVVSEESEPVQSSQQVSEEETSQLSNDDDMLQKLYDEGAVAYSAGILKHSDGKTEMIYPEMLKNDFNYPDVSIPDKLYYDFKPMGSAENVIFGNLYVGTGEMEPPRFFIYSLSSSDLQIFAGQCEDDVVVLENSMIAVRSFWNDENEKLSGINPDEVNSNDYPGKFTLYNLDMSPADIQLNFDFGTGSGKENIGKYFSNAMDYVIWVPDLECYAVVYHNYEDYLDRIIKFDQYGNQLPGEIIIDTDNDVEAKKQYTYSASPLVLLNGPNIYSVTNRKIIDLKTMTATNKPIEEISEEYGFTYFYKKRWENLNRDFLLKPLETPPFEIKHHKDTQTISIILNETGKQIAEMPDSYYVVDWEYTNDSDFQVLFAFDNWITSNMAYNSSGIVRKLLRYQTWDERHEMADNLPY